MFLNPIWTGGVAGTPTTIHFAILTEKEMMYALIFLALTFNLLGMSPPIMDVLANSCGEIIPFCQLLPYYSYCISVSQCDHIITYNNWSNVNLFDIDMVLKSSCNASHSKVPVCFPLNILAATLCQTFRHLASPKRAYLLYNSPWWHHHDIWRHYDIIAYLNIPFDKSYDTLQPYKIWIL